MALILVELLAVAVLEELLIMFPSDTFTYKLFHQVVRDQLAPVFLFRSNETNTNLVDSDFVWCQYFAFKDDEHLDTSFVLG